MPPPALVISVALFLGVISGCGNPETPEPPPDTSAIPIPSDVPEQYEIPKKGGQPAVTVDGRKFYIGGYQYGWEECYKRYKSGKLDLNDETAEPRLEQEMPLYTQARSDGFKACQKMLRQRTTH
jgi:hypothetical protein